MTQNNEHDDEIDWSLTTWEGARREAMRRWAALPLERIIAALEEMQETSDMLFESQSLNGNSSKR